MGFFVHEIRVFAIYIRARAFTNLQPFVGDDFYSEFYSKHNAFVVRMTLAIRDAIQQAHAHTFLALRTNGIFCGDKHLYF